MSADAKQRKAVDLIIHNIGELVSSIASDEPLHGAEMSNLVRVKNAALAVSDGKFVHCGESAEVLAECELKAGGKKIDAEGRLALPGFVDPHTHLVFGGNRANEFLMRCQGRSYQEIARAGGGIVASMSATRKSSLDDLLNSGLKRLRKMLAHGTTSCEVKTGYGLSAESELNMMKAIFALRSMQEVEIVPTFMPAHAFPPDKSREEYIAEIKEKMLPTLAELSKSEGLEKNEVYQDVFCDEGYFSLEESRDILQTGIELGFRPKVHADEFVNLGASSLAVELNASSADHLLNISEAEIDLMAASDTVAVLLPGTSFFLNLKEHAAARQMIDGGVAVALGSDFNPGSCHIFSMPFIIGLSCLHLKMTISEALCAATVNAAFALGRGKSIGQLKAGYQADFLLLDLESLEELPYNMTTNPVNKVFKKGVLVHKQ
ncbi:MAG: imidazolonepropionase [Candidatus Obscuribacterales bacterium]|nr:imidazolonepropionase [Candidatus Obscuribacterales bacterium]